jgi:hypothetical protein
MTSFGQTISPAHLKSIIRNHYQNRKQIDHQGNRIFYTFSLVTLTPDIIATIQGLSIPDKPKLKLKTPSQDPFEIYVYLQLDVFDPTNQLLDTEQQILYLNNDPGDGYMYVSFYIVVGVPRYHIKQLKCSKQPISLPTGSVIQLGSIDGVYAHIHEQTIFLRQLSGGIRPIPNETVVSQIRPSTMLSSIEYARDKHYFSLDFNGVVGNLGGPKTKLIGLSKNLRKYV